MYIYTYNTYYTVNNYYYSLYSQVQCSQVWKETIREAKEAGL